MEVISPLALGTGLLGDGAWEAFAIVPWMPSGTIPAHGPRLLGAYLSLPEAGSRESFSLSLRNAFLEGMPFPTAS